MVVSVSRRCDIPRFQFKWFMQRVEAGFCETANPYNARQIRRVSLTPGEVDALVFWTRDPRKILANAEELRRRGFTFYAMVTVTGYPLVLEPSMVRTSKVLAAMKDLARIIGVDRVIWRYDPIILTNITDEDFHRQNFDALARELAGSVRRVIISVYDEYKISKLRLEGMEKAGELKLIDAGDGFAQLLTGLAKSAEAAGMQIQSCAEKEDFSSLGIKPGACIDAELIKTLANREIASGGKDKNQRPNCLCCKSVDIGSYGLCSAGCVYCYAWG